MTSFTELKKIIKFIYNYKKTRIAKAILNRNISIRSIRIPPLKLYFRAIVTKVPWCSHKKKHID